MTLTAADVPLKFAYEEDGYCRVYYKRGAALRCWQDDGRAGVPNWRWYVCSEDGEPSHEAVKPLSCPLFEPQTSTGRALVEYLKSSGIAQDPPNPDLAAIKEVVDANRSWNDTTATHPREIGFTYLNHAGVTGVRRVVPLDGSGDGVYWGSTSYYPQPQWLFTAFDLDRQEHRTFAVAKMYNLNEAAMRIGPLAYFEVQRQRLPADLAKIRELYLKLATGPLGMPPWERRADRGKPLLYGGARGLLASGTIGTWDEFDLIVATINALPLLLGSISPADEDFREVDEPAPVGTDAAAAEAEAAKVSR